MKKLSVTEANYLILSLQQQINRTSVVMIPEPEEVKAKCREEIAMCESIKQKLEMAVNNAEISL